MLPAVAAAVTPAVLHAATPARRLLVFGDSLSAGYGMAREEAWPSLLARTLAGTSATAGWEVVNASLSGETSHGGLARLPAALTRFTPAVVLIELGANDALRGLPLDDCARDLDRMVQLCQAAHARVLLIGVVLPPNFGDSFTHDFAAMYERIAHARRIPLVPNLLAALGASQADFQADGLHPLARVQSRLLATVLPGLTPLLKGS